MEEEMVEHAADKEEVEYTFTAYEIDLDYEFDAARFFDFEHDESPVQARQAELWFDSAGSYPPSPFVANLVPREGILLENINISPKSKGVESMNLSESDSDVEAGHEIMAMNYADVEEGKDQGTSCTVHIDSQNQIQNRPQNLPSGLTFYNHMANTVKSETQSKLSMKPIYPRSSTLMKPTASQLAKQNRPFPAGPSRSNIRVFEKTSKSSATGCVIENQAAKRQKLEGGLLRKVAGAVQLQETNFVHKAPKRDGILDCPRQTKPRITIPRDQHLETARRAQRLRSNSNKDEKDTSAVGRFKALPLNRKILEAPSLLPKRSIPHQPAFQEFHLKTLERAAQHGSAAFKSTGLSNHSDKGLHKYTSNITKDCGNEVPGRYSTVCTASRADASQSSQQCFKALPLNKKILTSKGDIGIFRNSKKETTVPMEFNFQTEKRCHDNPLTGLFNKLSLAASEAQVTNFESRVPCSISTHAKNHFLARAQKRTDGVASSKEISIADIGRLSSQLPQCYRHN
ncbi:protein TPX2-like isoform X2 [Salvia miltiorrhiza]|uniref:protein TPX2-like isoform X2 n=1 Tax=Salvia miltiorrhiza TaxID=226208 RepID=UPI0025AC0765|nr:protein TPX2-like isoform X2 [Salvia miltiorrhiza]